MCEIDETRLPKIKDIDRVIEIMKYLKDVTWFQLVEKELNVKCATGPVKSVDSKDNTMLCEIVLYDDPIQKNTKRC